MTLGFEQSLKRKENVLLPPTGPSWDQGSPTYTFSCPCAVPKPKDYKWAPGGGDVYLTGETGRFRERSMHPGREGAEIRAV